MNHHRAKRGTTPLGFICDSNSRINVTKDRCGFGACAEHSSTETNNTDSAGQHSSRSDDKDYKQIIDGLKKRAKFPAPVIIKDKSGRLYLLGGNTRLMLGVSMGLNLPVKIHSYKKDMK